MILLVQIRSSIFTLVTIITHNATEIPAYSKGGTVVILYQQKVMQQHFALFF